MPAMNALDSGNPDSEDESKKADRLAARAARFNNKLVGNRHKELEEARIRERKAYEQQGLISAGKTELGEAVDMQGTCEMMCSEYEAEFRDFTGEVHPLEARDSDRRRIDSGKAVAAYTRSDAGAGHGEAAKLPSDLRTPVTLAKTLDYLFANILPSQPFSPAPVSPTPRTALGYTAGFIRDRTRAIRKEFAMQSSWGQAEAIESFERIARWHILCLRELQEETGMNTDMHIDSAELGRCFTSLRQHYNDRREELGVDMPCANEPEFRAYMLIFDLTQKAVAISTAEVPSVILDHPNVQLAWQIRKAAQRNFDSQKEGSKQNSELGANVITSYIRLLKSAQAPYLLSCLAEVRLREMRRSALRSLQRAYPRLRTDVVRRNEEGQIVERRMVLISSLEMLLGCEEQETEESAWDDIDSIEKTPEAEAVEIVRRFGLEVYEEGGTPVGAIINPGAQFDDNKDAPYTRRWKLISDKRGSISYTDIINGKAGILAGGAIAPAPFAGVGVSRPASAFSKPKAPVPVIMSKPAQQPALPFSSQLKPSPVVAPVPPILPAAPSAPPAAFTGALKPIVPPPPFSFATTAPIIQPTPPKTADTASTPLEPTARPAKRNAFSFETIEPSVAPPTMQQSPQPVSATPAFSFTPTAIATSSKAPPAASEVLQRPSFFTTPAIMKPSAPTSIAPLQSAVAIPVHPTAAPLTASTSSLSSSTSGTPRKTSLKSLTKSTSRSIASPDQHQHHVQRRRAIRPISELLIDEVLQLFIANITPDVSQAIKSELAAREFADRKGKRKQTIDDWSEAIFDRLLDEVAADIAKAAFIREKTKRSRVRQSADHWREYTHEREEEREEAEKDRAEVWERLRDMGLGTKEETVFKEIAVGGESVRMEELEVDVGLHEAERLKEHFYSPSSFLHTIARHVSPIAAPIRHPTSPRFQILLSSAADASSAPSQTARQWLTDKLSPRNKADPWSYAGVEYTTEVRSRYDEVDPAEMSRVGLVLLEVPLSSALKAERDSNTADIHDRIASILDLKQRSSSAYNAPLMILSWQEETLDEIEDRLDLEDELSPFGTVAVMCLSQVDALDSRFSDAVQSAVNTAMIRRQFISNLCGVVAAITPSWQRMLDSASLFLDTYPSDANLAIESFRSGIRLLNDVGQAVDSWFRTARGSSSNNFNVPNLPAFPESTADDIPSAVLSIEEYIQQDFFAGMQDVQLVASTLHPASIRNDGGLCTSRVSYAKGYRAFKLTLTALPIPALLAAISSFYIGEIASQEIRLELYGNDDFIAEKRADLILTVKRQFQDRADTSMRDLSATIRRSDRQGEQFESEAPVTDADTSPKSTSTSSLSRSLKRRATGDLSPGMKESKSAKNARLLDAIKQVEKSLQEIRAESGEVDDDLYNGDRFSLMEGEAGLSF